MPQTFRELLRELMITPLPVHPSIEPDAGPPITTLLDLMADRNPKIEPFVDLAESTSAEEAGGTHAATDELPTPRDSIATADPVESSGPRGDVGDVESAPISAPDEPDWWFTTSLPNQPPPAEVAREMLPQSDSPPDMATSSPLAGSLQYSDPQRVTTGEWPRPDVPQAATDSRRGIRSDDAVEEGGSRTQPESDRVTTLIDAVDAHLQAGQDQQFRTLERLEELLRGALSARDDIARFAERLDQLETAHSLRGSL